MIFPSIDLMEGKAVQLVRGQKEDKKIEIDDVLKLAKRFSRYHIQLIDLDAAMGNGDNLRMIKRLCMHFRCRVGGGIRTLEKAKEIIEAGAEKIIIGSSAFRGGKVDVLFLKLLNKAVGKEKIIIAIDSKKGKIVVDGWKTSTGIKTLDMIGDLEPYCSEFLYTYVDREGMMQGTDFPMLRRLKQATSNEITAAGGISSMDEIKRLERIGVNSVLGMALYTGKIKLDYSKEHKHLSNN
ncbi:1-(5-phosphoribosyl)-5-[(5-phosphoribosylamino)methylideneamino] imidazole-4-carboxamide isomerase [Candidatus Woesearchaeota archaeon]|nr:1-(5-phosphoribosyl)-5-[(5-phosphoribosylamino)methylideneamino] imidazole-4-carboxamide isomerase [Candidatus Woesearchaeota archaeon]